MLHSKILVLENQLQTFHELTKIDSDKLLSDVRLLQRGEYVHQAHSQASSHNNPLISQQSDGLMTYTNEKWVNIRRQDILFDDEQCLLITIRDLSERKQLLQKQE